MSGSSPGERGDLVLSLCESARAVKRSGVWTWCGQRARADQKGRTTAKRGLLKRSFCNIPEGRRTTSPIRGLSTAVWLPA